MLTRAVLLATLAGTALAVIDVLCRNELEPRTAAMVDERGYPRPNHAASGLFFAGYSETPRGQLFEANRGARRLAATIDDHLRKGS